MSSRRPLWFRLLRGTAFSTVALTTLAALGLSWLSFSGRRDWARTKADLLARGEKLSLIEQLPEPGPDEQNFFGDPMWKQLADTVEVTDENGNRYRRPRAAHGQRLIDAWDVPASPALRQRILDLVPSKAPDDDLPTRLAALRIMQALDRTPDPGRQRDLAATLLEIYTPSRPFFRHLESLLGRSNAVFSADYTDVTCLPLTHLNYLLNLGTAYQQMARAHLILGQPNVAEDNVAAIFGLADTLRREPLLISHLVRLAILAKASSTIDRGIEAHQWTETNLVTLGKKLSSVRLEPDFARVLRGERGFSNQFFEALRQESPEAFTAQKQSFEFFSTSAIERFAAEHMPAVLGGGDQAFYNRAFQGWIDALNAPGGVAPELIPALEWTSFQRLRYPLSTLLTETIRSNIISTLYRQDALTETLLACALERYRFAHKSYPDSLSALVPAFLPAIPAPALANDSFRYRRESNDHFRLWCAGWDGLDEGGIPGQKKNVYAEGDWAWNQLPGSTKGLDPAH